MQVVPEVRVEMALRVRVSWQGTSGDPRAPLGHRAGREATRALRPWGVPSGGLVRPVSRSPVSRADRDPACSRGLDTVLSQERRTPNRGTGRWGRTSTDQVPREGFNLESEQGPLVGKRPVPLQRALRPLNNFLE